jgi:hypothetical protein
MKREAFKMFLKPGCEAEYEKRHNAIWPELKKLLSENGVAIIPSIGIKTLISYLPVKRYKVKSPRKTWEVTPSCKNGGLTWQTSWRQIPIIPPSQFR